MDTDEKMRLAIASKIGQEAFKRNWEESDWAAFLALHVDEGGLCTLHDAICARPVYYGGISEDEHPKRRQILAGFFAEAERLGLRHAVLCAILQSRMGLFKLEHLLGSLSSSNPGDELVIDMRNAQIDV